MRVVSAVLAALLLAAPAAGSAQHRLGLLVGHRVRVSAPALDMHGAVGRVVKVRGDTLILDVNGPSRVPIAALSQIEVSRGRSHTPTIVGAGLGAIGGAAAGLSLSGMKCLHSSVLDRCDTTPELAAAGAGALLGCALGTRLGALVRIDRWEGVPLPRVSAQVRGQGGGFALGVVIRL